MRLREDLEQAEAKLAAHIKQHRLQSIFDAALPESRIAAREAWYEEMESLSRILTTSFSGLTETLKRERLEQAAEGYISAKYESLREEYDGLLRLAQPPQNTTRQTIRGLKRIEGIERVFMSELIEGFAKSDMSQNETYHTALESFYGNWTQVIDLRNRMFLVAAPE